MDPSGSSRTVCDAIFFSLFLPYMLPATALLALLTSASNYISEDLKFSLDTALSMEIRVDKLVLFGCCQLTATESLKFFPLRRSQLAIKN